MSPLQNDWDREVYRESAKGQDVRQMKMWTSKLYFQSIFQKALHHTLTVWIIVGKNHAKANWTHYIWICSLISNIIQTTDRHIWGTATHQTPTVKALTAAIDTCESRPGHFIIIWSPKQSSLEGIPLSLWQSRGRGFSSGLQLVTGKTLGFNSNAQCPQSVTRPRGNNGFTQSWKAGVCVRRLVCTLSWHQQLYYIKSHQILALLVHFYLVLLFVFYMLIQPQVHTLHCKAKVQSSFQLLSPPSFWLNTATQWSHLMQ